MSFWAQYRKAKPPKEVDDATDWFQRPLGYLFARAALPTPLTPNGITLLSFLFSLAAGIVWLMPLRYHAPIGGALLLVGAILDASDGQLARMRGTQSVNGRMLDGAADGAGVFFAILGASSLVWEKLDYQPTTLIPIALAAAATTYTGAMHTSMFDHYKNVWLGITSARQREGESGESARARYQATNAGTTLFLRLMFRIYFSYADNQGKVMAKFDPFTVRSADQLPPFQPEHAASYRRHVAEMMPRWRIFGFGPVICGIAVFGALNAVEWYMALRLLVLHPLFLWWLRPRQQRSSRAAFAEMGVDPSAR